MGGIILKRFRYSIYFLFLLLVIVLAACGDTKKVDSSSEGTPDLKQEVNEDQIVINFAHSAAEANSRHTAILKFKELVEERSNNEIVVNVYGNEVLGSEPQMVESVELDELQMVASSTFAQYEPKMDVFSLPFLFDSNEKAWEVLDGPIGKEVAEPLLDYNLRILAHMENGMRHITNNKKPIETVEDLENMVIRVPEIPILLSIFDALGTNATPMAFGELYMALQQGTVDGQENPISNIHASKFYEVQKYLSLTGHSYQPTTIAISEAFWQSLSPEHQEIVEESSAEIAQFHRDMVMADEEKLFKEVEEYGMEINEPDKEVFREVTKSVYEEYENVFGKDLIERVIEAAQN